MMILIVMKMITSGDVCNDDKVNRVVTELPAYIVFQIIFNVVDDSNVASGNQMMTIKEVEVIIR